jgi:hypothetical protein
MTARANLRASSDAPGRRSRCISRAAADLEPRRRMGYEAGLEMLDRRLPGHPLTDALRFELAAQLAVPALAWLRRPPAAVTS